MQAQGVVGIIKAGKGLDEMIQEYGYYKTRDTIQSLYDKDRLNEQQARFLLSGLRFRWSRDMSAGNPEFLLTCKLH